MDALCINQDDLEERNSQVQTMGSIYQQAQKVYIWLGPHDRRIDYALKTILRVEEMARSCFPWTSEHGDKTAWIRKRHTELWKAGPYNDLEPPNDFWAAFTKLTSHPYWRRAWTMQEATLAIDLWVVSGDKVVSYVRLENFVCLMQHLPGNLRPSHVSHAVWNYVASRDGLARINLAAIGILIPLRDGLVLYEVKHITEPSWITINRWMRLALLCRGREASDPRDKLYSLLGFLRGAIVPDYARCVEMIYTELARLCIALNEKARRHPFQILLYAGHFATPASAPAHHVFVPSWVPNWDKLRWEKSLYWLDGEENTPNEGKHVERHWESLGDWNYFEMIASRNWCDRQLALKGASCGIVQEVIELRSDGVADWWRFCQREHCSSDGKKYLNAISTTDALARLLFLDRGIMTRQPLPSLHDKVHCEQDQERIDEVVATFQALSDHWDEGQEHNVWPAAKAKDGEMTSHSPNARGRRSESLDAEIPITLERLSLQKPPSIAKDRRFRHRVRDLTSEVERAMASHCLVKVSDGHIGWARLGVAKGDFIVQVAGCPMPVALRTVSECRQILIGSSFVLGLPLEGGVEGSQAEEEYFLV